MSSSATGVGMPICFLGAILLILTQKSSQKFGDVLGILSRGAEKKVAKKPFLPLSAMLAKNKGQPPIKRTVLFYKTLFYGVNKSRYSIFLLRSMEGTIFPFHLLKST